jgi:outer membrane protein TolC
MTVRAHRFRVVGLCLGHLALHAAVAAAQGAPPPPAGGALTLEEAVATAVGASPEIRAAEAQRTASRATRWSSWGQLIPTLRLSSGLNQSDILQRTAEDPITGGIVALPDSLISRRRTFGTSGVLALDWIVFDGGRRVWGVRQAEAEIRSADHMLELARARTVATVAGAYLDLLEATALERVQEAEVERAQGLLRLAQGRFDVGGVPEIDLLQAQIAAGDAELALMEASSQVEAARQALAVHLPGLDLSGVGVVEPAILEAGALPAAGEVQACSVEGNPEIASLRAQVDAARRGQEANRFWLLPTVTVGTTRVRSEFGQSSNALTLEPSNEQTYYRVGLSWNPLDQPGQRLAERSRALATRESSEAMLQSRRSAIGRDTRLAVDQLQRARQQEERRLLNLRLAGLQREQALERYRSGVGTLLEQLQGEALAREAERQAIAARYAGLRALAALQGNGTIQLSWQTGTWSCR